MKKLILKIVLSLVLLISIIGLGYIGIIYGQSLLTCLKDTQLYPKEHINLLMKVSIISFSSALIELIILITIIVKGTPYLFSSSLKEYHEHKKATSEARKQKKIEALEKELNELKKNEH